VGNNTGAGSRIERIRALRREEEELVTRCYGAVLVRAFERAYEYAKKADELGKQRTELLLGISALSEKEGGEQEE